jgi:hypothetical protein
VVLYAAAVDITSSRSEARNGRSGISLAGGGFPKMGSPQNHRIHLTRWAVTAPAEKRRRQHHRLGLPGPRRPQLAGDANVGWSLSRLVLEMLAITLLLGCARGGDSSGGEHQRRLLPTAVLEVAGSVTDSASGDPLGFVRVLTMPGAGALSMPLTQADSIGRFAIKLTYEPARPSTIEGILIRQLGYRDAHYSVVELLKLRQHDSVALAVRLART